MDSLHNLEQSRLQLEQQAAELDRMLDTWRKWEVDYEILKEEVTSARPKTPESLVGEPIMTSMRDADQDLIEAVQTSTAENFNGVLLNRQEIEKLLKDPNGTLRNAKQLVDLLNHRLEYVKGNVDSLSKRRRALSEQLDQNDETLPLDMSDQGGLPLTEIVEELDDDGNVISSSTTTPNEDLIGKLHEGGSASADATRSLASQAADVGLSAPQAQSTKIRARSSDRAQAVAKARAEQLAASLQYGEDENEDEDDDDDWEKRGQPSAQLATAQLLSSIADVTTSGDSALGPILVRKPGIIPANVKVMSSDSEFQPVVPEGESLEDAMLRRDLLDYNLREVGAVVAEMDIDEDLDGDLDEDLDDLEELDEGFLDSDASEEEDEYGRSLRPMITESYRKEMMELERRLGAGRIRNLGPEPGRISPSPEREIEGAVSNKVEPRRHPSAPAKGALKKTQSEDSKPRGVRFADNLDVSEVGSEAEEPFVEQIEQDSAHASASPLVDEVRERTAGPMNSTAPTPPRRISRFKASKTPATKSTTNIPATTMSVQKFAGPLLGIADQTDSHRYATPEGPANAIHADVVENDSPSEAAAPDEEYDDPALQRRQMASDYYAKRNAMIRTQGGFKTQNPAIVQLNEDGEEIRPKVSRFKAARLGKNQ